MSNHPPSPQLPPFDAAATLHALERRDLEAMTPPATPLWGQLDAGPLLRIHGLADFWEVDPAANFEQQTHDLLAGVHGQGTSVIYLILGGPRDVRVYMGLQGSGAEAELLKAALIGTFPGVLLPAAPESGLGASLKGSPLFTHMGRLTGIPTRKGARPTGQLSLSHSSARRTGQPSAAPSTNLPTTGLPAYQIERLLRGLAGQTWGYLVRATPVPTAEVLAKNRARFQDLSAASAHVHFQHTRQVQTMQTTGPNYQQGTSEAMNRDLTDYQAQHCLHLLERDLDRLTLGQAVGMWQSAVTFFAPEAPLLGRLAALLRAIFAGAESTPEPLRTFVCQPGKGSGSDPFVTLLTSEELAALIQFPRQEFPGYRIAPYTQFDLDPLPPSTIQPVNLGKVLDGARETGNWFIISRDDFAKHGLVAGVTGSGKTNTLFYLLDKLWRETQVPFLVIEPAKTEYRHLRAASIPDLQVYTLGDERWAPFRLNPFEFEIADGDHRIHVQTHIDYLKSVFNAAFILYAPMPYVLETCLHEIYQDRGWDLTTGHNRRLPPAETRTGAQPLEYDYPVFPTLADLYYKIDEVVDRLGYEERIQMDVKAGLKARVGSLLLGSKGLMLGARHSVPLKELLGRPTVLELEAIGSDDEKAFVIGLILTRLYEYRRVQAMQGGELPALQHVAVFEEAHRLLKNVPTEVETEEANLKGQAVETFANMLSEIRAYGQGVLIAEQIPAKLAPDAIKNTNLKLVHRIVAEDDRQVLGATMNLDERQSRYVTSLPTGQAVAYAEGADRPYLIQVPAHAAKQAGRKITNQQIANDMRQALADARYDPVPGYSRYLGGTTGFDPRSRDLALQLTRLPAFRAHFRRYFLSALLEPGRAVQDYGQLLHFIRQETTNFKLKPDDLAQLAVGVFLHALDDLFKTRGRGYNWLYNVTGALRDQAAEAFILVARGFDPADSGALARLTAEVTAKLATFATGYRQQTAREHGPFAGCVVCQQRCLYRYDVTPLVADEMFERNFVAAMQESRDDQVMWQQLACLAEDAAIQIVAMDGPPIVQEVALCYVSQMGSHLNFRNANQRKLVMNTMKLLAREEKS
jgi:DNA helicase HerA-like ATPase